MQTYPVRVSHRGNLRPEALEQLARSVFESATREGDSVLSSYGALQQLKAGANGKNLGIEVTMNPKVPEAVAAETIRRYNRFLEETTGYNAKERAKRARKSSSSG